MLRRQEAGLPVLRAIDGQFAGVLKHDVRGQILIFWSEAIANPWADGRQARLHAAAVRDE